jgi:hypothetical protein
MMADHMNAGSEHDEAHAYFVEKRSRLLEQGYQAIEVVENDGRAAMGVILDLTCIRLIEDMPRPLAPNR